MNNLKKTYTVVTLPGDSLSGGQSPTARCVGAKLCPKTRNRNHKKYVSVLGQSRPTLP